LEFTILKSLYLNT